MDEIATRRGHPRDAGVARCSDTQPCLEDPAMRKSTRTDKNARSNRATTSDTNPIGPGAETTGALELEYPAGRGLYRAVFDRFAPEIADELVDTRAVRMLVELEYNIRRAEAVLLECNAVGDGLVGDLDDVRACLDAVLWATCEAIAETVGSASWARTDSDVEWTSGDEFLE